MKMIDLKPVDIQELKQNGNDVDIIRVDGTVTRILNAKLEGLEITFNNTK